MSVRNGVPYQFWMPDDLHAEAMEKSGSAGLDLSTFMRVAVEQFVNRPLAESVALLEKHNKQRKQQQEKKNVSRRPRKSGRN